MSNIKYRITLIRHGQSLWNNSNRFTGWTNIPLTEKGKLEAEVAGELLNEQEYRFTKVHTSVLQRTVQTWNSISEKMDLMHIPVEKSWRLNEMH